jgi:hypothetical protein
MAFLLDGESDYRDERSSSICGQTFLQSGDRIFLRFETDGKPQQALADARHGKRLLAPVGMRHGGGMQDQAFDAARRFRKRREGAGELNGIPASVP